MNNQLSDAIKSPISMKGFALLQWGFDVNSNIPSHSLQMPEEVIDQILTWRDQASPNAKPTYEFTKFDVGLPVEKWRNLVDTKYLSLTADMKIWLNYWEMNENAWLFESEDERIAFRVGHFSGWFSHKRNT